MKIDKDTVTSLAHLARLDLLPEEEPVFAAQLPKILDYVGQLQKVETSIAPDVTPPSRTWRPDEKLPSRMADDILEQSPDREERWWRVPSVL